MNFNRVIAGVIISVGVLSLISCAQLGTMIYEKKQKKIQEKEKKKPLTGIEAYQRAGGRVSNKAGAIAGGTATAQVSSAAVGITKNEDIVWAPENPDEDFEEEFEDLWKKPENTSWHVSYVQAMGQSRETGKPVLVWFTNSQRSPLCRVLSNELFSNQGFDSWASKNIVRLRVDENIKGEGKGENAWTQKQNYIKALKKKYRVHGHPTVIILSPSGGNFAEYRGYKKGGADYYWAKIKTAISKAEDDYGAWLEKLEKRGYRMWTNRQGRKVFSKLYRYSDGKVTLIDPDGKRGVTSFSKLSEADQAWIIAKKEEYDQRAGR